MPAPTTVLMVHHARACLLGMVNHLVLPNTWVEIRVESGVLIPSVARIATELRPRDCLIGPARLGPLSPSAGLAAVIGGLSGCALLRTSGWEGGAGEGLPHRVRLWLAGVLGTSGLQAGQGEKTAAAAQTLIVTDRQGYRVRCRPTPRMASGKRRFLAFPVLDRDGPAVSGTPGA